MEKKIFKNQDGLIFGLSEKADGDMKIHKSDKHSVADINRQKLYSRLGLNGGKVVSVLCAHGKRITEADARNMGCLVWDTDGLISDVPGITLSVSVADCAPVYLFDPRMRVIALVHAGWRGTVDKIAEGVVKKMIHDYGSRSADIQAFIGPHIQVCHFEVKEDVAEKFHDDDTELREAKIYVNLASAIRRQLLKAGLTGANIKISEECTYCEEKYFSARRDKFPRIKAGLAYLGMDF